MKTPFLAVTLLALSTTVSFAKGTVAPAQALEINGAQIVTINADAKPAQADTTLSAKVAKDLASRG